MEHTLLGSIFLRSTPHPALSSLFLLHNFLSLHVLNPHLEASQMNQETLFLTLINPLCSFVMHPHIILFTLLIGITLSDDHVDPTFLTCQPKTCGNDQNISYPFYIIGKQESFCGYPGFELTCGNNGFPIINLTDTQYIIQEIFYTNQSIRVSNPVFSEPNTYNSQCIAHTQNLTVGSYRFQIASNQKDMFLFYGCDLTSNSEEMRENRIGCSSENKTSSVLALYSGDPKISVARKNCKGVVNTIVEDEKEGIGEALRNGFVLNWSASDCSACLSSGGRCGFDTVTYTLRCYCRDRAHSATCPPEEPKKLYHKSVVVKATVSATFGVGALIIIIYCIRWRLRKENSKAHQDFEVFLKNHGPLAIRKYSYLEIKKMTNSFAEKLGEGGYGGVFKGKMQDENFFAVKVLNKSKGNGEEFINEVASISRTSHVNIVTLLGYCFEGSKRALVYEFMSNGSLEKFIYQTNPNQLSWEILYKIAIGVARGLEYLHRGCNTRIFHFDIKPDNILLDENFIPKISDFGLAKICPRNESIVSMLGARGTPGYIAPEVFSRNFGVVSQKSDVYSFGMMVLEMVGGRKNINVEVGCTSEIYFPHWIYKRLELNEELSLRNISDESDRLRVRKMVIVSLWCIQTNPSDRPTIHTVVEMLEGRVETLQIPPKPFLSSPPRSPHHYSSTNQCNTSQSVEK